MRGRLWCIRAEFGRLDRERDLDFSLTDSDEEYMYHNEHVNVLVGTRAILTHNSILRGQRDTLDCLFSPG